MIANTNIPAPTNLSLENYKILDDVKDIINNPSSTAEDVAGFITSTQEDVAKIPNPIIDSVYKSPSTTTLTSALHDTVNTILGNNTISSLLGGNSITDPLGKQYYFSDTVGSVDANTINNTISSALDSLIKTGGLSDYRIKNLDADTTNLLISNIGDQLSGLLGTNIAGLTLVNSIMDSLGNVFGGIFSEQNKSKVAADSPLSFLAEQAPALNLTTSTQSLPDNLSAAYKSEDDTATRQNPLDPKAAPGLESPPDRHNTPIGAEPASPYKGRYPYNKSYRSESGHIVEVDDTPGEERLLDQHTSGTYQEMKPRGDHVIKVVGDNYTAVAGANKVSVEGDAQVYVGGNCRLHVGGTITIVADGGLNFVSKKDFRVKARSINLETISGDFNVKSAQDTLITSVGDMHTIAKTNHLETSDYNSMIIGGTMSIETKGIGIASDGPITGSATSDVSFGGDGVYLQSKSETNILAGSTVNIDGTDTLIQAGGAGETPNKPSATTVAKKSPGSGIGYSPDPSEEILAADDDPDAMAAAIKNGISNGTIDPESLRTGDAAESDTDVKDNGVTGNNKSTIGNVGPTPPDNLALSPHYKLFDLTKGCHFPHAICGQQGLSASQMAQNLQLVAINILEPIRKVYPDVFITSAFRPGNGKSQHQRGQAVDMQFRNGSSPKRCYEIAQWIKNNVAFDQLILEYSGPSRCWIHCSYNGAGNRPASNKTKVMTMIGGKYTPGLHLH